MTYRPLFIGGCDRSGTTMLGDILGASAQSFATPESQWVHQLAPRLHLQAFDAPGALLDWLCGEFRFAVWDMDRVRDLDDLDLPLDHARACVEAILRRYLERNLPEKAGAAVWVDHTPDNVRYYPLLRALFPDARYVHIVRDGRAMFQSVRDLDWGPNNAYMGTRFWAERLEQALGVEMAEGGRCLRVRYEDILRQPAAEIERVCAFAELPYDEGMLNGGGLILPEFTRGQHQLVGKPPDASRLDAWRKKLSRAEIEDFEAWPPSRLFLQRFGYALDTPEPVQRGGLHTLWCYLQDFGQYLRHRLKHRRMEQAKLAVSVRAD